MTAILWNRNRLYADSLHVKGEEKFHSLTKIHALDKPLPLRYKKENIDDVVVGWVCTGAELCGEGYVHAIEQLMDMGKEKDLSTILTLYDTFERFNLAVYENLFEVILIGGKANYTFIFSPLRGRKPLFDIYPHTKSWGIGSGGPDARAAVADGAHPIRAMYHAFYRDECSGGMVDVWELTPGESPTFQRVGVYHEVPKPQLPAQLLDMKADRDFDLVPQLTLNKLVAQLVAGAPKKKAATKKISRRSTTKGKKA